MKFASLFANRYIEDFALSMCADRQLEPARFRNLTPLLCAMRHTAFDAFILEDDTRELGHWLAALQLRGGNTVPIIVFGEGGALGISRALQRGADDYATHGAGPDALLSRMQARMNARLESRHATRLEVGALTLDAQSQCLRACETEIFLTSREFALAWALFENLGRVVTFNALSVEIWGRAADIGKRTIEQHVYKLRRKLGEAVGTRPDALRIQTVYGIGYRLIAPTPMHAAA